MLTRILRSLFNGLEALGRARAAGILARSGRHIEAKRLMLETK